MHDFQVSPDDARLALRSYRRRRGRELRTFVDGFECALGVPLVGGLHSFRDLGFERRVVEIRVEGFERCEHFCPGLAIENRSPRARLRLSVEGRVEPRLLEPGEGYDVLRDWSGRAIVEGPWARRRRPSDRARRVTLPRSTGPILVDAAERAPLALEAPQLSRVLLFGLAAGRSIALSNRGACPILLGLTDAPDAPPAVLEAGASGLAENVRGRLVVIGT